MGTLFRRCQPAAGGLGLIARRDWPEILLPDNAAGVNHVAGAGDVLAAWQQCVSAAQFGAVPLTIAGVATSYRIGLTTAAGAGGLTFASREARLELGLGAPAAPPALIGRHKVSGAIAVSVTNPGAATVVSAIATPAVETDYAPVQVPANSVLSVRAAFNDALGNYNLTPIAIAYDPALYNLQDLSAVDLESLLKGTLAVQAEHTDYVAATTGALAWTNGAWVTVTFAGGAVADRDYLVRGVTLENVAPAGFTQNTNGDLSTLSGGVNTIQSRFAIPAPGGLYWPGPYHFWLPLPFYLAQGETLQARIRGSHVNPGTRNVAANLWALP